MIFGEERLSRYLLFMPEIAELIKSHSLSRSLKANISFFKVFDSSDSKLFLFPMKFAVLS